MLRFLLVGCLNTLVGVTVMYGLYQAGVGYWVASAGNVLIGGICSFVMNRNWTFRSKGHVGKQAVWFCLEQLVCYVMAYGLARPFIGWLLQNLTKSWQERISMAFGMLLFVLLNYGLQRNFVFYRKGEIEDGRAGKRNTDDGEKGR